MVRIDEVGDNYIVRIPKNIKVMSALDYQRVKKFTKDRMDAFIQSVYASAIYENTDEHFFQMEWDSDVLPAICKVLELSDEWREYLDQEVKRMCEAGPEYLKKA